jgi:hypothetical protein
VNVYRPLHIGLLCIECNPYHSIGLDWFVTLAGMAMRDDRLGLPFGCSTLWLGGCDPYILSCMFNFYAINA